MTAMTMDALGLDARLIRRLERGRYARISRVSLVAYGAVFMYPRCIPTEQPVRAFGWPLLKTLISIAFEWWALVDSNH